MRNSGDAFRYKTIDYRKVLVIFMLLAILVYCVVTDWSFFMKGAILPRRIFFGLLGLAAVYWLGRSSKDLQLFLPTDKPHYTLGNGVEEIHSLQVHSCLSTYFPMKFLRINTRLLVIVPIYKNPFENNPKAIQKLKREVIYLKDYIVEHELDKKNVLDSVAKGINFSFRLLVLLAVVAMAWLLFKIFTH